MRWNQEDSISASYCFRGLNNRNDSNYYIWESRSHVEQTTSYINCVSEGIGSPETDHSTPLISMTRLMQRITSERKVNTHTLLLLGRSRGRLQSKV